MKFKLGNYYKYICQYGKEDVDTGKIILFKVIKLYHSESKSKEFITGRTLKDQRYNCNDTHIVYFCKENNSDIIEVNKDEVMLEML